MPSYSEIGKHIGVGKAMVAKLVSKGMPTNTKRAALLWRKQQNLKRAPTNGVKAGDTSKVKTAKLQPGKKPGRPRKLTRSRPARTGDSLKDALTDSIQISNDAYEAYQDAKMNESSSMSSRLSEYNKALAGRLDTERAYREEMERRGILVLKSEITDKCRRGLEAVVRLLNKLPVEQGPQCNPGEPLMAVKILQRKVDEIKVAVQGAMADL